MPKDTDQKYNFGVHIHKVLKQVHPDTDITLFAKSQVNLLLHQCHSKLVGQAAQLLGTRVRMNARDIQTAVRLHFPGELAKHAVSEGTKAVTKYTSFVPDESKGRVYGADKAGLKFPPSLVQNIAAPHNLNMGGAVYLAGVLEYISAEILELAGNAARDSKRTRITNRHLYLAIENDEELSLLFDKSVLGTDVLPNIHSVLLPRKKEPVYKRNKSYNQWKRRQSEPPFTYAQLMEMSLPELNWICKEYKVRFCWGEGGMTHDIEHKRNRIMEFFGY